MLSNGNRIGSELGAGITLTDRDRALLADLCRFSLLTGTQLQRLHFPSPRRARRRLVRLCRAGLLLAHRVPASRFRATLAYQLSDLGRSFAGAHRWSSVVTRRATAIHILEINEFVTLYSTTLAVPRLREFVPSTDSRVLLSRTNGRLRYLEPDGSGVLETAGGRLPFFLEWDRGTESSYRFSQKVERYLFYWRSEVWRDTCATRPHLLVVVPDQRRADLLARVIGSFTATKPTGLPVTVALREPVLRRILPSLTVGMSAGRGSGR